MEKKAPSMLTGPKIYNFIVKGNGTLRQLAAEYACSYDVFVDTCKAKIGSREWPRVVKADARNAARPKKEVTTTGIKEDPNTTKEDTIMEQTKNLNAKIEAAKLALEAADAVRMNQRYIWLTCKEKVDVAKDDVDQLRKKLENARKKLTDLVLCRNEAKDALRLAENDQEIARARLKNLENELEQMNKIYLIAPGFQGEIPEVGRLVSSISMTMEGLELEFGEELVREPTLAELLETGFDSVKDIRLALEFAKLVIKYQTSEQADKVVLLVDDDRMKTILHQQGVDI